MMNTQQYLDQVAYLKSMPVQLDANGPDIPAMRHYVSRQDSSWITTAAAAQTDELVKLLMHNDVTEIYAHPDGGQMAAIGFSPSKKRWFGWSQAAMRGFAIGDSVCRGDIGYQATNHEDFRRDCMEFWRSEHHRNITCCEGTCKGVIGVWVEYDYTDLRNGKANMSFHPYPQIWGRGEWTAETLDDCRQMAADFVQECG